MARRTKRRIGGFSNRMTFSNLDGRTNSGRYVNSINLDRQLGGFKLRIAEGLGVREHRVATAISLLDGCLCCPLPEGGDWRAR
jgi:hypothetical protein